MGLQVGSPREWSSSSCLPWPPLWLVCSAVLPLYSLLPIFYKDTSHVRSQPYSEVLLNLNSFLEACFHTWSPGIWGFNICIPVIAMMSFLLFMEQFGKGLLSPLGSHTSCETITYHHCIPVVLWAIHHAEHTWAPRLHTFCFVFLIRSGILQATLCFTRGILSCLLLGLSWVLQGVVEPVLAPPEEVEPRL